jgi:hypothetical protein
MCFVLDNEAPALMALGYRAASYLELYCPEHGAIRCAVKAEGPLALSSLPALPIYLSLCSAGTRRHPQPASGILATQRGLAASPVGCDSAHIIAQFPESRPT